MENVQHKDLHNKIHELERQITLLRNQIESYNILLTYVDIGIVQGEITKEGNIDFINSTLLDIIGYTEEQFCTETSNTLRFFNSKDEPSFAGNTQALIENGGPIYFQTQVKRRDNRVISLLGTASAFNTNDDKKTTVIAFRKLSFLHYIERDLEKLELLMKHIVGGVGVFQYSDDFPVIYINEAFSVLTGYSAEEIKKCFKNNFAALIHEQDIHGVRREIEKQISKNASYSLEYRLKRKDGKVIWVLDNGILLPQRQMKEIPFSQGIREIQSTLIDITMQKATEEALRVSEKRYEVAMQFADVTIFDYNIRENKITVNESDRHTFGMPRVFENGVEEIINSPFIAPQSRNAMRAFYKEIDEGALSSHAIISAIDKQGKERIIELQLVSIFDNAGMPIRAVGVRKDITETSLLKREQQYAHTLASAHQLTYEANISKDTLIYCDPQWLLMLACVEMPSYSRMLNLIYETDIVEADIKTMYSYLMPKNIIAAYKSGKQLLNFQYRRQNEQGNILWFEHIINIIEDSITHDISIRSYASDITEKKEKELRAREEQTLYEQMISKSALVYEVNITQNEIKSGTAHWQSVFHINPTENYTEMMQALYDSVIHSEDRDIFNATFAINKILVAYRKGIHEIQCEYRRPNEDEEFVWMRCMMHLFEDPETGDIRGFSYIDNINDEKKKQLDLIYKSQHDALTGVYNKAVVEEKVDIFLANLHTKNSIHAFFIIDLDYFKKINDTFGHLFGDEVLSHIASRLALFFRDDDIIGRIGGDEFVVLMKYIKSEHTAQAKAQEICTHLRESFGKDTAEYTVSVSIGLAFYATHGQTYKDLYRLSDIALYYSKNHGRTQYAVYSPHITDDTTVQYTETNELNAECP